MGKEVGVRKGFSLFVQEFQVKNVRERKCASHVGTGRRVTVRFNHITVNARRAIRPELVRAINLLDNISEEEKNRAYRLLRVISPRRQKSPRFYYRYR